MDVVIKLENGKKLESKCCGRLHHCSPCCCRYLRHQRNLHRILQNQSHFGIHPYCKCPFRSQLNVSVSTNVLFLWPTRNQLTVPRRTGPDHTLTHTRTVANPITIGNRKNSLEKFRHTQFVVWGKNQLECSSLCTFSIELFSTIFLTRPNRMTTFSIRQSNDLHWIQVLQKSLLLVLFCSKVQFHFNFKKIHSSTRETTTQNNFAGLLKALNRSNAGGEMENARHAPSVKFNIAIRADHEKLTISHGQILMEIFFKYSWKKIRKCLFFQGNLGKRKSLWNFSAKSMRNHLKGRRIDNSRVATSSGGNVPQRTFHWSFSGKLHESARQRQLERQSTWNNSLPFKGRGLLIRRFKLDSLLSAFIGFPDDDKSNGGSECFASNNFPEFLVDFLLWHARLDQNSWQMLTIR